MYGVSVYIEPKDVLAKLSEEDKKRFNQCVFTDVDKDPYGGGITIHCLLFNSADEIDLSGCRYKLIV